MLPEDVPCKYARYPLGKACLELGKDYAVYSYTDMNDEHDYEVCFGGHEDILVEVYNLLCWVFLTVIGVLLLMLAYIYNKFNFEDCKYSDLWFWGWIVIVSTSIILGIPILIGLIII